MDNVQNAILCSLQVSKKNMDKKRHTCVRCGRKRFARFLKHPIYFGVIHNLGWVCKNPYWCYHLGIAKKKAEK